MCYFFLLILREKSSETRIIEKKARIPGTNIILVILFKDTKRAWM